MTQREIAEHSALGFLDDIYDRMRKEGYPQELKEELLSHTRYETMPMIIGTNNGTSIVEDRTIRVLRVN